MVPSLALSVPRAAVFGVVVIMRWMGRDCCVRYHKPASCNIQLLVGWFWLYIKRTNCNITISLFHINMKVKSYFFKKNLNVM